MEIKVGNNKIPLHEIVSFYAPVFVVAFSSDEERQDYISITFASLDNDQRYTNDVDLNEAVFYFLSNFLQMADKYKLFHDTFYNLKLVYDKLIYASETLKQFIRHRIESEIVYTEINELITELNNDENTDAANLLQKIVTVYSEDGLADFSTYQNFLFEKVLMQIEVLDSAINMNFRTGLN